MKIVFPTAVQGTEELSIEKIDDFIEFNIQTVSGQYNPVTLSHEEVKMMIKQLGLLLEY